MQKYSLEIDDFSCDDYSLIGIHTTLEDYKLAYLLNDKLDIQFSRAHYDLDFHNKKNEAVFPIYQYINKRLDHEWFLISNIYKERSQPIEEGLFRESDTITYLISEKKRVDFFLKMEGNFDPEFILKSLDKINQIKQVITSYTIETDSLKSKEFLIF
ncbi:IPExxxVDY family protein [Tenacibaculum sp.]|nr:IPExxxVDY family protein [Tenacibaculum sp.]